SFALMIGLVFALSRFFGGRAAYMHMGAVFGTLMVANVWVRILPAQQKMIDATKEGRQPDFTLSAKAKLRSVHNSYLTLPVLFLMLSNHYPMTYGSEKAGLILLLLFVLGASVRHYSITKEKPGILPAILILVSLGGLAYLTIERPQEEPLKEKVALESVTPLDVLTTGTISGTVRFTGSVPAPKKISITPECASTLGKSFLSQEVQVQGGRLQNAFVWISEGLEGKKFATPAEEIIVDQRGCRYEPRVMGVQVGQPITFLNSDPFLHNIHSMAKNNEAFNLSLTNKNQKITRKLQKEEIMFRSKCDLHPWMSGFIGVVSHPYFAVSNETGEVILPKVPAGTYTLSVWHETLGIKNQKIEIGPQKNTDVDFIFP
ncbi:MAG: urate hydroxylase PuuD, partial [Pseudomonadota bacterium]